VLTQCQGPSPHLTSEDAGGPQEAGRGHSGGQLTTTDQRDIPYRMTLCSVYKVGEERGRGGSSEWWHLSSQVTITYDGALLSWRWLNTGLTMGNSE